MSNPVELVHRPALKLWASGSISWSLHFNDLRPLDKDAFAVCLTELKMLALFDDVTLIRDADVVNHIQLLEIFREDVDEFRAALRAGVFVFPIRADADSFTQVNDRAGVKRAHPERFARAAQHLPVFDHYLADWEILTPKIERSVEIGTFPTLLRRVLPHLRSKSFQYDLLQRALTKAEEEADGAHLRFGDIYKVLAEDLSRDEAQVTKVIQWCRAAHVLTVPYELGLPPTSANSDIDPWTVAIVLGHSITETNIRKSSWFQRFPKLIPNDDWIEHLTFDVIVRLRDRGFEAGYFRSVAALQKLDQNDPSFDSGYEEYLDSLSKYLQALEWETKASFVDWQDALANDLAKLRKEYETYWFRTPVAIGLTSLGLSIAHHSPIASVVSGGVSAASELAKTAWDRHRIRHPEPIAALLAKGTTRTPPKKIATS